MSGRNLLACFSSTCECDLLIAAIHFAPACVCSYAYPGDITVQIRATDATTGADRRSIIQNVAWAISQNHCPLDPSGGGMACMLL
jgi:hypothetical protein